MYADGEATSFDRACAAEAVGRGNEVSAKTIERVTMAVGNELAELRDAETPADTLPMLLPRRWRCRRHWR